MRAAALLLLGLGAGFVIGYGVRPEAPPPRAAAPQAVSEGRGDRAAAVARVAREETAGQAFAPPVEERPAPEAAAEASEGVGWLEVDCRGSDVDTGDVEVRGRSMFGELTEMPEASAENGVVRFELWAGEHVASWRDRRVAVRVRAGEVVRLDVTSPRRPGEDPIAPGLGRLLVTVLDLDGRPIPEIPITVRGPGAGGIQEDEIYVGESGSGRADVLPGPYRVVLGDQVRHVRVREGEESAVVLSYEAEGELELRVPLAGHPALEGGDGEAHGYVHHNGVVRFVRAGVYDVYYVCTGELGPARHFGQATVVAGRRTVVEPALPGGGIRVRITGHGAPPWPGDPPVKVVRLDPGVPQEVHRTAGYVLEGDVPRYPGAAEFLWLPAGRWRVEYAPKSLAAARQDVTVGDAVVEIELRLEPER